MKVRKGKDPEFHAAIQQAARSTHEILNRAGLDSEYVDSITLNPSDRMRGSAGIAHRQTNSIALNRRLLKMYPEHLLEVVVHEVCHMIDAKQNGVSSHGERWQALMRRCGYDPQRFHGMDASALRIK